jgi:hypothetical protein
MSELAREFGISRKTGYEILNCESLDLIGRY